LLLVLLLLLLQWFLLRCILLLVLLTQFPFIAIDILLSIFQGSAQHYS
jgi:hypothetical protein